MGKSYVGIPEPSRQSSLTSRHVSTNGDELQIFARNPLVAIVPALNRAGITTLQDLATPNSKLVLANPAVPVGNCARQALAPIQVQGRRRTP
jgi:hypothetical protein